MPGNTSSVEFKPDAYPKWRELNQKQRKFVQEYLVDYNATAAAIRAGYANRSARNRGQILLRMPVIQGIIRASQESVRKKAVLRQEDVIQKLSDSLNRDYRILNGEDGFMVSNLEEIPQEAHIWIDGFEVKQEWDNETGEYTGQTIKVKCSPNAKIIDMAMRHVGGYERDNQQKATQVSIDFHYILNHLIMKMDRVRYNPIERKIKAIEAGAPASEAVNAPTEDFTGNYSIPELVKMGEENDD